MHRVLYAVLLVTFLLVDGWVLVLSGEDENQPPIDGRHASTITDQGIGDSNAQWFADPERGWLRAEDRYDREKGKPLKIDYGPNRFQGTANVSKKSQ